MSRRLDGGVNERRMQGFAEALERNMSVELIDELEAGELSVEFEGEEPDAVLEWAFERFAPRIAISTALQTDNVILIDLAYKLYPEIQVFTIDTGRLPEESHQAIEDLRISTPVSTCACCCLTAPRSSG